MKIAQLHAYHLTATLPEPYAWSRGRTDQREATLVRLVTSDGVEGWGECAGPPAVLLPTLADFFAPLLLGQNALQTELLWDRLWQASASYGRRGVLIGALSGVDMALWDLKGQATGLSLAELFGGRVRDRVPCFATGLYFREGPEAERVPRMLNEARHYIESGYRSLLVQVGRSLPADTALLRALRKEYPDTPFSVEAHGCYDVPEATTLARSILETGGISFTDPLPDEPLGAWERLKQATPVTLAAGRYEQTRWGFQGLLETGAVGVLHPNLTWCGGPSEALKIRTLASAFGVNVVPRAIGTQLGISAALHFLASDIRHPGRIETRPPLLERDGLGDPLRDQIFERPVAFADGIASVPTRPGLGVTIDTEAMLGFCVGQRTVKS